MNNKPYCIFQDLLNFIDDPKSEGTIYISFGSFAKMESLPEYLKQAFLKTFLAFPNHKILWKYDGGRIAGLPSNVKTLAWFPQQDILGIHRFLKIFIFLNLCSLKSTHLFSVSAHPKTKAFVSHGGNGGYQEAIYCAVPLVMIPIFAEQNYNAILAESKEIAKVLNIETMNQQDLETALHDILTIPK